MNLRRVRTSITHATMRHPLRRSIFSLAILALLTLFASVAFAQTRVRVQVRGGEADVTLTAEEGGGTYRCRTQDGTCTLEGVATGSYVATAEPIGEGRPPLPRRVMVAGGEVTVHLHLR